MAMHLTMHHMRVKIQVTSRAIFTVSAVPPRVFMSETCRAVIRTHCSSHHRQIYVTCNKMLISSVEEVDRRKD